MFAPNYDRLFIIGCKDRNSMAQALHRLADSCVVSDRVSVKGCEQ